MFKKILVIFALSLSVVLTSLILCSNAHAASANVGWARIEQDDVYLFATDSDAQRRFILEKSYYVEIIEEGEQMYLVSVMQNDEDFPRIMGYVYKSQVKLCTVPPIMPYYPTVKVTVTGGSAALKLSPLASSATLLAATNTQRLSYYGKISNYGTTWYYVYYGDSFGYVDASCVSSPNITPHPTPLTKPAVTPPSEQSPVEPETEQKGVSPASEVLLIVFVVLLAVGLTLALFLPGNVKKSVFEKDI